VVVGKNGSAQMLSVRKGAKAILQRAIDVLPQAVDQVFPAHAEDQAKTAEKASDDSRKLSGKGK
jgi:hypothetical protein